MPLAISETMRALCSVVQSLPVGTNLALLHFLWMLLTGALLTSRGALFPALVSIGLLPAQVRRAWAAFRHGAWDIATMLHDWNQYVLDQAQWSVHRYDGYVPKPVDITPYWRPRLKSCLTKHYHSQADKALPAVTMGLSGRVGCIGDQRLVLLDTLVRSEQDNPTQADLREDLLQEIESSLAHDDMPAFDAGFRIRHLQEAKLPRWLVRLPKNFTARRNTPVPYKGRGPKPEYGTRVRPLARTYKGKHIDATLPDRVESWQEEGIEFRAEFWDHLVLPDTKATPDAANFHVAAIYDSRFKHPWLLASPISLTGPAWYGLYRDRWPIEQVPLVAKPLLGSQRQFVFAEESCYRLPELTLLAASIQTYLAATLPAVPTGFWDRDPRPTAGRLRRVLAQAPFPEEYPLPDRIRKKASVTEHLPKGVLAHRRTKQQLAA